MPRRVYTYDGRPRLGRSGTCCRRSAPSCSRPASLLFFVDALRTWRRPRTRRTATRGSAGTLEWLPPSDYGVRSIPRGRLARAAVEPAGAGRRRSTAGRALAAGHAPSAGARRSSPARAGRGRCTCCCCPATAGRRSWPRVGTAGFFLLLTVKWLLPAFAFGIVAVAATLVLAVADRPAAAAPDGRGRPTASRLPVGATGRRLALVVGDGGPGGRRPDDLRLARVRARARRRCAPRSARRRARACPPTASPGPSSRCSSPRRWRSRRRCGARRGPATRGIGPLARSWRRSPACSWRRRRRSRPSVFVLRMHGAAGLAPVRDAWSATVAALVAWQVFHAVVLVADGGLRDRPDRRRPRRRAEPGDDRQRRPLLAGAMLQGALGVALVQLLPRVLG